MPLFEVNDEFGNTLTLEGDSDPTEQELEHIFDTEFPDRRRGGSSTPATLPPSLASIPRSSEELYMQEQRGQAVMDEAFPQPTESMRPAGFAERYQLGFRQAPLGRALLGPTELEQGLMAEGEIAGPPGGDPGVVPLLMSAPYPLIPGQVNKAGKMTKFGKGVMAYFAEHQIEAVPDVAREVNDAVAVGDWQRAREAAIPFALQSGMLAGGLMGSHDPRSTARPSAREGFTPEHPDQGQAISAEPSTQRTAQTLEQRIQELSNDPEATGRKFLGFDADGAPRYEQNIKNARKAQELADLLARQEMQQRQRAKLSPEDQAHLDAEIGKDQKVELVEEGSAGDPFAMDRDPDGGFTGEYMTINRENGSIVIFPREFARMIEIAKARGKTTEQIREQIRSDLNHESIHLRTSDTDALSYWNKLTSVEQWINWRRYQGENAGETSDTNLGHEALRFRIQQASKMTPSEFLQMTRGERWTWQGLTALEKAVRGVREHMTDAGKEQRAIFDRVLGNIDAVKTAAGGTPPAARTRDAGDDSAEKVAKETIEALEADAAKYRAAGQGRDADELEGYANTLKQQYPGWNQQSFPAARNRNEQYTGEELFPVQSVRAASAFAKMRGALDDPRISEQARKQLRKLAEQDVERPGDAEQVPPAARSREEDSTGITREQFRIGKNGRDEYRREFSEYEHPERGLFDYLTELVGDASQHSPEILRIMRDNTLDASDLAAGMGGRPGAPLLAGDTVQAELIRIDPEIQEVVARLHRTPRERARVFVTSKLSQDHSLSGEEIEAAFNDYRGEGRKRIYDLSPELGNIADRAMMDRPSFPAARTRGMSKADERKIEQHRKLMALRQGVEAGTTIPATQHTPEMTVEPATPSSIDQLAASIITADRRTSKNHPTDPNQPIPPSFKDFEAAVRSKHGNIEPGALTELWQDQVWKQLQNVDGATLERLVDQLQLRRTMMGGGKSAEGRRLSIADAPSDAPNIEAAKGRVLAKADLMMKLADRLETQANLREQEPSTSQTGKKIVKPTAAPAGQAEFGLETPTVRPLTGLGERERFEISQARARAKALRDRAEEVIAAARRGEGLTLEQPTLGLSEKWQSPAMSEAAKTSAQRTRARAIAAVGQKLASQAAAPRKSLTRTDITPDDLRWSEGDTAYQSVPADLDPVLTAQMLVKGAGTERSTKVPIAGGKAVQRRSALPESATKRITTVLDTLTKKVYQLSTYRHGRKGVVMLDPVAPGNQHRPLESMVTRYKPLFTSLLDAPVQNFRREYANLETYNKEFGNAAKARSEQASYGSAGVALGEPMPNKYKREMDERSRDPETTAQFFAEGTEGIEGQGAYLSGPDADLARIESGMTEGSLRNGADLTPNEARIAYQSFRHMETARDAHDLLGSLAKKAGATERNASKRSKISLLENEADKLRGELENQIGPAADRLRERIAKIDERIALQSKSLESGLTTQDHNLVNVLRKTFEGLTELNPKLTPEQVSDLTLDELYRLTKNTESEAAFAASATRRLATERPLPSATEAAPTGREIVAPRAAARITGVGRGLREQTARVQAERAAAAEARGTEQATALGEEIRTSPQEESASTRALKRTSELGREARYEAGREQEFERLPWESRGPAALNRNLRHMGRTVTDAIRDTGSAYDEWMVNRIARRGGPVSEQAAEVFKTIIDREKQLYGDLTPKLDEVRKMAGGQRDFTVPLVGNKVSLPTPTLMRATTWLHGLNKVTGYAATSRMVGALERTLPVPAYAQPLVNMARDVNIDIGRMVQPVSPGFVAGGGVQRNPTATGYDAIRSASGDLYRKWTAGLAVANGRTLRNVRAMFREWKAALDTPGVDDATIAKVNQDFKRELPKVITHVHSGGRWQEVVHSDLFNYLENAARRATHTRAFRESFPNDTAGRRTLHDVMEALRSELDADTQLDLDAMIKTMQGRPTDNVRENSLTSRVLHPSTPTGQAFHLLNNTVGNLMANMVLTAQGLTQSGELISGATSEKLGTKNYLRGLAKVKQLYPQMETDGSVNRVIYDMSFDPHSPIRSLFRLSGNVLSRAFVIRAMNEFQEAAAASTAYVVAERIRNGQLTSWERRNLPQTFSEMGFKTTEIGLLMAGDPQMLGQFQRSAASFLTSGNKASSEGSRLATSRIFNSIFRFQSYPMMKANQLRQVFGNFAEAWQPGGTKAERIAASERVARFMFFNTMQGALTVAMTTLGFSGKEGLKIKGEEAKDEPLSFLAECFMASMSGPLYVVWRGMRNKGVAGVGEQATRLIFPYTAVRELIDASSGHGQYRDLDTFDRIGKFLQSKTPGTKAIATGLAAFGVASESRDLDTSVSAFYRWRRGELGFSEREDFLNEDTRKSFRVAMRKAVDAAKDGDMEKFSEMYVAAATSVEGVTTKSVKASLRARKILKTPDGKPLTMEQIESLRQRIGDSAVDRIEYFDAMLEALAR